MAENYNSKGIKLNNTTYYYTVFFTCKLNNMLFTLNNNIILKIIRCIYFAAQNIVRFFF